MIWYKAWLETRWIFGLFVGLIVFVWLTPLWMPLFGLWLHPGIPASRIWMAIHLGSVFTSFFVANSLAGSGVNSQTAYSPAPGNDGSMLFTLSLPVSRRRLLFVRAGLGALLTNVLIAVMAGYTLSQRPEGANPLQAIEYLATLCRDLLLDDGACATVKNRFRRVAQPAARHDPDLLSSYRAVSLGSHCGVPGVCRNLSLRIGAGAATQGILIAFAVAAGAGGIYCGAVAAIAI